MSLIINHIVKTDSVMSISACIETEFDIETLLEVTNGLASSYFRVKIDSREILSSVMGTDGERTNYQILLAHRGDVGIWYHHESMGIRLTQG